MKAPPTVISPQKCFTAKVTLDCSGSSTQRPTTRPDERSCATAENVRSAVGHDRVLSQSVRSGMWVVSHWIMRSAWTRTFFAARATSPSRMASATRSKVRRDGPPSCSSSASIGRRSAGASAISVDEHAGEQSQRRAAREVGELEGKRVGGDEHRVPITFGDRLTDLGHLGDERRPNQRVVVLGREPCTLLEEQEPRAGEVEDRRSFGAEEHRRHPRHRIRRGASGEQPAIGPALDDEQLLGLEQARGLTQGRATHAEPFDEVVLPAEPLAVVPLENLVAQHVDGGTDCGGNGDSLHRVSMPTAAARRSSCREDRRVRPRAGRARRGRR